ncbi:hypothetical protein [Microbacterium sp. UBA837]|uniref:hypothetical protein n=1 Tax=Microbacterium sp. UBA837 TaxID=1946956 RepID=UPI0025E30905|nr:hypothetical protein [Microbacterium sp. UBA837]
MPRTGSLAVARIQIYARHRRLYDNRRTQVGAWALEPTAAETLRREHNLQLTTAEAARWLADYEAAFGAAYARRGYLGPRTVPAYRRLQEDAAGTAGPPPHRAQHWSTGTAPQHPWTHRPGDPAA